MKKTRGTFLKGKEKYVTQKIDDEPAIGSSTTRLLEVGHAIGRGLGRERRIKSTGVGVRIAKVENGVELAL